jgi:hypothetical protein
MRLPVLRTGTAMDDAGPGLKIEGNFGERPWKEWKSTKVVVKFLRYGDFMLARGRVIKWRCRGIGTESGFGECKTHGSGVYPFFERESAFHPDK